MGIPDTVEALSDYVIAHYEDMLGLYGVESGLRQARKHLGWYFDRHAAGAPAELRRTAITSSDPAAVMSTIREAFCGHGVAPAASGEQTRPETRVAA